MFEVAAFPLLLLLRRGGFCEARTKFGVVETAPQLSHSLKFTFNRNFSINIQIRRICFVYFYPKNFVCRVSWFLLLSSLTLNSEPVCRKAGFKLWTTMDVHNKKKRSYNMSCIKGKNTKPEMLVRKILFANGCLILAVSDTNVDNANVYW